MCPFLIVLSPQLLMRVICAKKKSSFEKLCEEKERHSLIVLLKKEYAKWSKLFYVFH